MSTPSVGPARQRGSVLLLTLLMIILMAFEVALVSMVVMRGLGDEGVLTSQNVSARSAAESALTQLEGALDAAFLSTDLATLKTNYALGGPSQGTYNNQLLQIKDPATGTTAATNPAVYTSAWIDTSDSRGQYLHLVGRARTGGVDLLAHRWHRLYVAPAEAFDCVPIETQILAGNIASIADADLIKWAQNNCMLKRPTGTPPTSGSAWANGTAGNDTIYVAGDVAVSTGNITMGAGNDTIFVGGTQYWNNDLTLTSGSNVVYMRRTGAQSGGTANPYIIGGTNDDQVYVDEPIGAIIQTGAGDDIISCVGVQTPNCMGAAAQSNRNYSLYDAGAGNDIISIDASFNNVNGAPYGWNANIWGGTGSNIIYVKGFTDLRIRATDSTTPSPSLVIIGGDRIGTTAGLSTITGYGSNCVLMLKTGTTDTGSVTTTGFARTLTY